jgi:hypothetical protein
VDPSGIRAITFRVAGASFSQNFRSNAFSSIPSSVVSIVQRHDNARFDIALSRTVVGVQFQLHVCEVARRCRNGCRPPPNLALAVSFSNAAVAGHEKRASCASCFERGSEYGRDLDDWLRAERESNRNFSSGRPDPSGQV